MCLVGIQFKEGGRKQDREVGAHGLCVWSLLTPSREGGAVPKNETAGEHGALVLPCSTGGCQ